MSDTKTHLGIPGHAGRGYGLDLWGRVPRAEALPRLAQHAERLEHQAAAIRAALAAGTVEISYWRGHKRVSPPVEPAPVVAPATTTIKRRADAILPGDVILPRRQTDGRQVTVTAAAPRPPSYVRLYWRDEEGELYWYNAEESEEIDILAREPERAPCAACGEPNPDGPVSGDGEPWCSDCYAEMAEAAYPAVQPDEVEPEATP